MAISGQPANAGTVESFLEGNALGTGLGLTVWELLAEGAIKTKYKDNFGNGSVAAGWSTRENIQQLLGMKESDFGNWQSRGYESLTPDAKAAVSVMVPLKPSTSTKHS